MTKSSMQPRLCQGSGCLAADTWKEGPPQLSKQGEHLPGLSGKTFSTSSLCPTHEVL